MASQIKRTGCTAIKKARSPHQPAGQWIRSDSRLAIYLRDAFLCLLCTRDLHNADPKDITLDHIKPKSDGGSNKPENLYTCCRSCNCSRQDKPIERIASKQALNHIRRNAARDMKEFKTLAKALIIGKTGSETT